MGEKQTQGWALLALVFVAVSSGAQGLWPSSEPSLACTPEEVRWDSQRVARCAPPGPLGEAVPAGPALTLGRKLSLNTASLEDFELLPGFGPSLARLLVQTRERVGGFTRFEQVEAIRGIGPSKCATLRNAAEIR